MSWVEILISVLLVVSEGFLASVEKDSKFCVYQQVRAAVCISTITFIGSDFKESD